MRRDGDIPLRDYVDARFTALEELIGERFRALEREVAAHALEMDRREEIHHGAHSREHQMTKESIDDAGTAMQARLVAGEALHRQTTQAVADLLPRSEFATAMQSLHREMGQAAKLVSQGRGMLLLAAFLIPVVVSVSLLLLGRA